MNETLLVRAYLENCSLVGCGIWLADFSETIIENVNFSETYIEEAIFTGSTIVNPINLDKAIIVSINIGSKETPKLLKGEEAFQWLKNNIVK